MPRTYQENQADVSNKCIKGARIQTLLDQVQGIYIYFITLWYSFKYQKIANFFLIRQFSTVNFQISKGQASLLKYPGKLCMIRMSCVIILICITFSLPYSVILKSCNLTRNKYLNMHSLVFI